MVVDAWDTPRLKTSKNVNVVRLVRLSVIPRKYLRVSSTHIHYSAGMFSSVLQKPPLCVLRWTWYVERGMNLSGSPSLFLPKQQQPLSIPTLLTLALVRSVCT